ncbi:MAG: hypothetical protein A3F67_03215 [Verrucomicrobia bacterium RIFCSPHIGHO2_12_FULL_41_10]|nr:MAG: hypothetical protein A3F67_03215 [Verrucomicrobia bacterium RIFCSPHIGHO2_12_FULL_41_10]HLB33615.1 hypothetical protein [Chthoniobacterales bacterium]
MKTLLSLGLVSLLGFSVNSLFAQSGNIDNSTTLNQPACEYATHEQATTGNEDNALDPTSKGNQIVAVHFEARDHQSGDLLMASAPVYYGKVKIDDDGCGSSHNDKYHDPHTAWEPGGRPLNADTDSYVVAPPWVLQQGIKLGSRADVYLFLDDDVKVITSIVGDTGPNQDVGEMSIAAARELGIGIRETSNGPMPTYNGSDADLYVYVTYYF